MDGDPYRSAGDPGLVGPLACPRCGGELAGTRHERLDCTTHKLQLRAEPPPATCPICKQPMMATIRARVVFDYCMHHGVWLDRNEREALEGAIRLRSRLFGKA